MGNYVINEIYSDGYERFAIIEDIGKHIKINVHFLEYDEYLESSENSQKRTNGDILDGDLSIQLITFSRKVDVKETLIHFQKIQNSPHIEAVIEATQIIFLSLSHSAFLCAGLSVLFGLLLCRAATGGYQRLDWHKFCRLDAVVVVHRVDTSGNIGVVFRWS